MLSPLSLVLLAAASAASSGSDLPSSFQTPEPLALGKPPLRVQAPAGETSLPLLPQLGGAWPQAAEFFFEVAQPFADRVRVCVRSWAGLLAGRLGRRLDIVNFHHCFGLVLAGLGRAVKETNDCCHRCS
jgi:hypothetical protein